MATTKDAMTGINGTKKDFPFTFPYIKTTDLKVELFDASGGRKELDSTKFSMANATTISLSAIDPATNWQETTGAPKSDVTGNVYRNTSDSGLVATFYPGSAIRSGDLNDNYTQNLYSTQENTNDAAEALDNSRVLESGAYVSAITKAANAITIANTADGIADAAKLATDTYVHDGTSLKGDGQGGNPQGVKYAVDQAVAAVASATTANNTADAADVIADKALDATDTLVATKSGSTWTLQGGGTTAQNGSDPKGVKYAVDKADDAVATANTANTTAGDAETKADGAISTANDAETKADAADAIADAAKLATDTYVHDGTSIKGDGIGSNPKGVAYAINTAESAQTAVANSTTYKLTTNKTTFEANTFDATDAHEAWEIGDSTGISSSYTSFTDGGGTAKTITGIPSSPTFDSGLSSRFTYNHSTNTFTWVGYWVNDSEDRYGGSTVLQNLITIGADTTLKSTHNALSVGPVTVATGKTLTIPTNSRYVVL